MIGRRSNRAVTAPFLGLPMFAILVAGCSWLPAATPPNVPGGNAAPPEGESAAGIINAYGAEHPEAYAGVYLDGDVLTVLIVGDIVPHEAAIRARVPAGTKLAFRPVRWTEAELEALQDRISNASEWFGANDAFLEVSSLDTINNVVLVQISSADPNAPGRVIDHFQGQGKMRVDSDGTGVMLRRPGHLAGRVVDKAGKPIAGADVEYEPLFQMGPMAGVGHVTDADGRFDIGDVAPGRWRVEVWQNGAAVASAEVDVPSGGRAEAVIVMDRPQANS